MKIGIDIDEVVVEFVKGYIKILEKNGISAEYNKTHSYNFWDCYPITREEAINFANELYDSEHFENMVLIEGAFGAINFLEKNNEIFFITSRPLSIKQKTLDFVKKHFPNSKIEIVFSGDFHKINGKTKAEICKELGISVLIEDNKDYALDCAKKGTKVFLMSKPWNKNYESHENLIKVTSWDEILEQFKLIGELDE